MGVGNEALTFPELLFAVFYKLKVLSLLLKHFILQTMRFGFECPWLYMVPDTLQPSISWCGARGVLP